VRGGVAGIDQRSRYIETLADIERTSLDYYATIRSLYRQRRAALIRHERENLPPPAGFSQREDRGSPEAFTTAARRAAVVSEASNISEVAK
jgi:ABC-type transporter lipoprotein component MlaA